MARKDNSKRGEPSHGNQGNQPFTRGDRHARSDNNGHKKGGRPLQPQERSLDAASDRKRKGESHDTRPPRGHERTFNIVVDNLPYVIKAIPFRFNGEMRYRVSFNGSPEHVFTWDSSLGQLRAIDDDSSTMPDDLELAISESLQSKA